MVEVRVPASTANVGSGFDCFGIALSMYNSIRVSETEKGLYITNYDTDEFIPVHENNLIYRSVVRAFDEVGYKLNGLKISQKSNIPMTRGLGSSSACIAGGLIAGNIISGRKLSPQRIFELANEIEGHPDNVAPALFGGFCISSMDEDKLIRQTIRIKQGIKFVAMIPDFFVATKKSRELLPEKISVRDAVYNISHASSLVAAFATGNYDNLSVFCGDRIHQPYRSKIIDNMDEIINKSKELGALGAYLSGSGPTIISIIKSDDNDFASKMQLYFKEHSIKRKCAELSADNVGAVAIERP